MDIAQLAEQQPAPCVVAAIAATIHTHTHPTLHRGAARAVGASGAGPAEV